MSVYHEKLIATEQPKCGWQTEGQGEKRTYLFGTCPQVYSKGFFFFFLTWEVRRYTWVEIEILARWKVAINTAFFIIIISILVEALKWLSPVMLLREMREAPWQTLWMKSRNIPVVFYIHSMAVFREKTWPDRLRRLKLSDPCFANRLKEESGRDRGWSREVYSGGGRWGRGFYWI